MKEEVRVMVTGVGGGGIGEQLIKALRLSEVPYVIVGGDMTAVSKGLMEVDVPYLLPRATAPDYLERVLAVCARERVAVLLPGSEPELLAMARHREAIEREGIFLPIEPDSVLEVCSDKAATVTFLQEHGFTMPRTVQVTRVEDLREVDFLPAVLKPSVGAGGSAGVMIAQSREEVEMFGTYMLGEFPEFVAQEYVGTVDSEFTVGVLHSMDGELINTMAMRRHILSGLSNRIRVRNRTGREELGPVLAISSGVSQGEVGPCEEVTGPSERMAAALGARGPLNIQGRLVEGTWYVFEINPRFSGTTPMRALMGFNEPDLLIRTHLLGEKVAPRFPLRTGQVVRGLDEVVIDLSRTNRTLDPSQGG